MRIVIRLILLAAISAGIVYCINLLGRGQLTARESGMMSIVLTGLSILASWVATEMYASSQHKAAIAEVEELHRTNLRTYALKAAEKVTNLSNELARLSTYLQQELDYTDYRNVEEELQAKEERVESAIHLVNTLKSFNDNSLSDWQGVIGDELDEQRDERHEREEELHHAIGRMEELLANEVAEVKTKQQSTQDVRFEIESLRRDLRLMLSAASGVPVPLPRVARLRKNHIEKPCPSCGALNKYTQRPKPRSIKAIRCSSCETRLVARYDQERGHYLVLRVPITESISCPNCKVNFDLALDPVPGSCVNGRCAHCDVEVAVFRTGDGFSVGGRPQRALSQELNEDLLDLVRKTLPAQPWPKHIHRTVASQLQIAPQITSQAINELIRRGVFLLQIDGMLYRPVSDSPTGKTH